MTVERPSRTAPPQATVIVPTRDRPANLVALLGDLRRQDLPSDAFEIVVVDDGSIPPITLQDDRAGPRCTLVRLAGVERSRARNAGAAAAQGALLVFLDDDMSVAPDFLKRHLESHLGHPGALVVGAVRLPDQSRSTPFGRFRQALEDQGMPASSGWAEGTSFCTAQNLSIDADSFRSLGGFDPGFVSAEDQDIALRHRARGGGMAFLPEARAVHKDSAMDIRSYCRRTQWGSEHLRLFHLRYPDRPETRERDRVNGPLRWRAEPLGWNLRRLAKSFLSTGVVVELLFRMAGALERRSPDSPLLDRIYRLLIGAHLFRGYRRSVSLASSSGDATPAPAPPPGLRSLTGGRRGPH
jgi:GT2 family glycosyltransferase